MIHHGVPALLRPGEVPDLSCVRIVALCTEGDPPPGDFLSVGGARADCPVCLRLRIAFDSATGGVAEEPPK